MLYLLKEMNNQYLKILAVLAAMVLIPAGIACGTEEDKTTDSLSEFSCYDLMQPLLEAQKAGVITTAELLQIWEDCDD